MRIATSDIATAVNGSARGPEVTVDGADIDSRSIGQGQLFVPIVAERDGHDFIDKALARGAAAYLTSDPTSSGSAIQVEDTSQALLRLGKYARMKLDVPTIAITGSVGKTSVKDLSSAALSNSLLVHSSPRSFNNELGLPLTLINAPEESNVLILEMGARGPGEITKLCEVARPDIGVVTSVAMVHTELFGTVDNVAKTKAELIACLPRTGTAVLNADDERVIAMGQSTEATVLSFGANNGDVRVEEARLDDNLCPQFWLATPWGRVQLHLKVAGLHNATNAAAAVAAGLAIGAELDSLAAGIEAAQLSPSRMAVTKLASGAIVIDDAYNANPTSMKAALDALNEVSRTNKLAVLGLMAELGPKERVAHEEIAKYAESHGIRLIAVATDLYGIKPVADWQAAADLITPLASSDAVIIKGSLVAGLQALASYLLE